MLEKDKTKKGCNFVTFLLYYNSNKFVTIIKGDYIVNKEKLMRLLKGAGKIINKSKIIVFFLIIIIGFVGTTISSGVTIAYAVEYNGEVIAQIKDKSEYERAVSLADKMVDTVDFQEYVHTPEFKVTFATKEQLTTLDNMALNILEQTDNISAGTCVFVNGKSVAYLKEEYKAQEYIDEFLKEYIKEKDVVSSFIAPVQCIEGYFHTDDFTSFKDFEALILSLDVQSVKTVRSEVSVAYETEKRRDDSIAFGVTRTYIEGVKGINHSISNVIMVNGKEVKTEYVGEEVVIPPVKKVVTVGNKGNYIRAAWIEELNCIWPLQRVKGQNISSYWGDGRNHKGLDIASAYDTEIYAVQAGTVITAEYNEGYGYYVVIEHNGGFKTLYGHASQLCVEKGDKVDQGQLIAFVGSTGMSTGNHLHFEIIRNGEKLDPSYFLGL